MACVVRLGMLCTGWGCQDHCNDALVDTVLSPMDPSRWHSITVREEGDRPPSSGADFEGMPTAPEGVGATLQLTLTCFICL